VVEQGLTAEVGEEPEEKRKAEAEDEAGDDGEIKHGVFATMDDVAGEASETERKSRAEIKKCAEKDKEAAEDEQGAAEFAERIHQKSLEQIGSKEIRK